MYTEINKCRGCGNSNLIDILSLGDLCLAGVFPKFKNLNITKGPLNLVWCSECSLLQLKQTYSLNEMYGDNYGYRSALNQSMVKHLQNKVKFLEQFCPLSSGDLVLDIGSNDATTLKSYSRTDIERVGIDPTGEKFRKYYPPKIELISDFFPLKESNQLFSKKKAKIITSIAMFYDLESPGNFVQEIVKTLDEEGVWHFEQSYMPSMLKMNAYDTICQEHLEYYSLTSIMKILGLYGLKILNIQFNNINGGSFAITVGHKKSKLFKEDTTSINQILEQEKIMGLNTLKPYLDFKKNIFKHKKNLIKLLNQLNDEGKTIIGYGASTKGNILLQFCGITEKEIPFIAEVNEDKFNTFTPGTNIKIISEKEARLMNPDYFFVLPWHFKNNILSREQEYRARGGKFIFPLPNLEVI